MTLKRLMRAALLGCAVTTATVSVVHGQTLNVLRGEAASTLNVAINRAVVVESEVPFAELSIANPGIADISTLSDRTIYVLGRAPGRTTLTMLGPEGNLIANVEIAVTPDVAEFKERLRQILPGENIEVRTANDGIVLSGTVSSIVKLDRAIELANRYAPDRVSNMMSVGGTQQVQLKVRFVEMSRSISKGLNGGIAGNDIGTNSAGDFGLGSGFITPGTPVGTGGDVALDGNAVGQINIGFELGGVALSVLLEALETKSLARTLSEPNLVALSGQSASFLAGGEYPIPVPDDDGLTIEYRPYGVQLNFTPTVVEGDLINLQINAAVSSLDNANGINTTGGIEVSAFTTRSTETTVEMLDGQSFAIAGLLADDFNDDISQVPWIGDVPILGALFRSASYRREQTELVIIVTPHLVSPVNGEALALPSDRVRLPSEGELFLLGSSVGGSSEVPAMGGAAEVAKQDFSGSVGYVME